MFHTRRFSVCCDHFLEACWQPPRTKYPAEGWNMVQTWRFSVCCDHFWKPADNLQQPNILLKAKILSKRKDLVFAVTTFGSLLTISKNQISCRMPKLIQTWRFSVCCYHFWKPADNLQKPNILPKTKIWSKGEDLVFAVTTFGRLLTTSKNQISCRRRKWNQQISCRRLT